MITDLEKKKKRIAILRGGKKIYHNSLKSGANLLLALKKYEDELEATDIHIDQQGQWFERGVPSDYHRALSKVDYYLDMTRDYQADYHDLAKKINLPHLFENSHLPFSSRLNIKRILQQLNILNLSFPKYVVFRDKNNLKNELKLAWQNFHLPIVIRSNNIFSDQKSLLTYSFTEAENKIHNIFESQDEAILEEHVLGKYISLAVIPNYRGQELYIPIALEIINKEAKHRKIGEIIIPHKFLISHNHQKNIFSPSLSQIPPPTPPNGRGENTNTNLKDRLKEIAKEIHKALVLDSHSLIDMAILEKNNNLEIKILEVHTDPHLFSESRFTEILSASGVDMGKFILDRIESLEEKKLVC